MKRTKKTFADFASGAKTASTVTLSPELQKIMLSLEATIGSASNEGGIKFLPEAMKTTVDVSDVTLEDCRREGIIEDIEKVFADVARHDMEEHNEIASPDKQILFEDMPGSRVEIRRLSNMVLPTAISQENGLIYVNEDFVKIMYKLAPMGLRSDRAEMGKVESKKSVGSILGGTNAYSSFKRSNGSSYLGNFYFSLLYSVAIHEIRGHFSLDNGVAVLSLDENFAQGERGRGHIVPNLVATLIFWRYIVEGESSDPIYFLTQCSHLKRYLSEWDDRHVLDSTLNSKEDSALFSNGPSLMRTFIDLPRVSVMSGDFVPAFSSANSVSRTALPIHPAVTQAIQLAEKALKELQEANTPLGIERRAWDAIKPVEMAFLVAVRKGNLDSAYSIVKLWSRVVLDRVNWVKEYAKTNNTKDTGVLSASLTINSDYSGISELIREREARRTKDMVDRIEKTLKSLAEGAYNSALPGKGEPRNAPTPIAVARAMDPAEDALEKLKLALTVWDIEMYAWDSCKPVITAIDVAVKEGDVDSAYYVIEKSIDVIRDRVLRLDKFAKINKKSVATEHVSRASAIAEQASVLMKSHDSGKIKEISTLLREAFRAIAAASDELAPPHRKAHHADQEAFGADYGSQATDHGPRTTDHRPLFTDHRPRTVDRRPWTVVAPCPRLR